MAKSRLSKYTDDQLRSNRRALAILQGAMLALMLAYIAVATFLLLTERWKDNQMLGIIPLIGLALMMIPLHLQRLSITKEMRSRSGKAS